MNRKIVGGGTAGGALGTLAVYFASRFGWSLTASDGAAIVWALASALAVVAHYGIRGIARLLWRGQTPTHHAG